MTKFILLGSQSAQNKMANSYRLDVYDTSGGLQYQLVDFLFLSYLRSVNAPGMVLFQMAGDHDLLANIADKWQVEVWRRPTNKPWVREMTGIYRDLEGLYSDQSKVFLYCPGIMSMLGSRIVNWYSGYDGYSMFLSDPAETVMKRLVDYNAAANATTGNGRKRNGAITGLTVEADGANGNTVNWYCHGQNLLATIQDIALIAGGDFDLVKTSSTAWQFRWYTGQLGTDRSASITFSMSYGNMGNPYYLETRTAEKTVASVWGQGEEAAREYVTRTGANYISGTNDFEIYVDGRDVDLGDTAGLNSRGDQVMAEREAVDEFIFEVIETPSTLYGIDYFLGDKVTAINPFTGASKTLKVNKVTVTLLDDGTELIEPVFTTVL